MEIEKKLLKKEAFENLVNQLIADGKKVLAPVKNGELVDFAKIASAQEMTFDYILTVKSAKSVAFPKIEQLFTYTKEKNGSKVADFDLNSIPDQVIFGVRPCDAVGFGALSAIFNWDYKDVIYTTRLERTTIIGMSCNTCDDNCFCTSVGGNPGNTDGNDILLTKMKDGNFIAEIITEKGQKLVSKYSGLFDASPSQTKEEFLANVPQRFNLKEISENLSEFFDSEIWAEQSLRCIGCGACAFVCPTCACFDIQDENKGKNGTRMRLWDSCGLSLFTLHTSGHNPREMQSHRWRQRILHKFSYMPERLNVLGCVGCGRCSRACPVDMNIVEHLSNLTELKK